MTNPAVSLGERELDISRRIENESCGDCRLIKQEHHTLVWTQRLQDQRPAVLKMYRHIGLFDWTRYRVGRSRVEREFQSLSFLDSRGIPCTKPIFRTMGTDPKHGRFMAIATEEIPDVTPLGTILEERGLEAVELTALYALVHRMHENGFYHGTLNAMNILVSRSARDRFYLLDPPQSLIFPGSIVGTRMAWSDLVALTRSTLNHSNTPYTLKFSLAYGLTPESGKQLVKEHVRRLNRHERNFIRAEFSLRNAISRLF